MKTPTKQVDTHEPPRYPVTVHRTEDNKEWPTLKDAQLHQRRLEAVKRIVDLVKTRVDVIESECCNAYEVEDVIEDIVKHWNVYRPLFESALPPASGK